MTRSMTGSCGIGGVLHDEHDVQVRVILTGERREVLLQPGLLTAARYVESYGRQPHSRSFGEARPKPRRRPAAAREQARAPPK